jgi:hypothetical protein
LSQTIRQLEARLGARLLNRTTRSVAPTEVGARLYDRIMPMMQEMDAAVAEAVAATGRTAGTLRINTLTLFWQIIRGTGFPNQIFSDSWVVGLMEGRPWRARGQIGNANLGDGSSLSWRVWVTRRDNGCVRFMWLG